MIRESENTRDDPIRIVVELPADIEVADRRAEEAMGAVLSELVTGRRVLLETTETTGRVVAPVADRVVAGRRLARSVPARDGR